MALIICITLVLSTGLFMTGLVDLLDRLVEQMAGHHPLLGLHWGYW